jgi:hypothetical protein
MEGDPMAGEGGVILRGDDGSVYFIRDEILEACKTDGEDKDKAEEMAGGEVEGFSMNFASGGNLAVVGRVESPDLRNPDVGSRFPELNKRKSTIMCPW